MADKNEQKDCSLEEKRIRENNDYVNNNPNSAGNENVLNNQSNDPNDKQDRKDKQGNNC